jgi:hypothetical protein
MCDLRSQRDGIAGVGQHLGAPGTKRGISITAAQGPDSRGARWRSQFTRSCGYARRRGPRVGWSLHRSCGSVAPAHRSTATGRILLQGNGIGAPGAKHRLDDPPRLDGLVATH